MLVLSLCYIIPDRGAPRGGKWTRPQGLLRCHLWLGGNGSSKGWAPGPVPSITAGSTKQAQGRAFGSWESQGARCGQRGDAVCRPCEGRRAGASESPRLRGGAAGGGAAACSPVQDWAWRLCRPDCVFHGSLTFWWWLQYDSVFSLLPDLVDEPSCLILPPVVAARRPSRAVGAVAARLSSRHWRVLVHCWQRCCLLQWTKTCRKMTDPGAALWTFVTLRLAQMMRAERCAALGPGTACQFTFVVIAWN